MASCKTEVLNEQNQSIIRSSMHLTYSIHDPSSTYDPQLRQASLFSKLHTRAAILRSASMSGSATTALATAALALAESVAMTFCVLGVCCSYRKT